MTLRLSRRGDRGAYTLMELLVVIVILMTLVAITLPIAKKVMEDSGPREASRQLAAMFSLARSKAANTGRPWGVWLECERPLATSQVGIPTFVTDTMRYATKVYLAEVPPSYAGDFTNSRALVNFVNDQGPWPITWSGGGGPANALGTNPAVASLYPLITGLPYGTPAQKKYDFFIRFNNEGPFFRGYVGPDVVAITGHSPAAPYVFFVYGKAGPDQVPQNGVPHTNPAWGQQGYDDDIPPDGSIDELDEYLSPSSDDIRPPFPQTSGGVSFQVFRQAERVGNLLELPSGSCVDLAYSGMGNTGAEFSGLPAAYSYSFGSSVSYYSSIVVMFFPGGGVESIYLNAPPTPASAVFGQRNATGTIHFLIGKVEKLNFPVGPEPPTLPNYLRNMFDPQQSNLSDPTALWLSVGRMNGSITTSENVPPTFVTSSGTQLTFEDPTPSAVPLPPIRIDVNQLEYHNSGIFGRPKYLELCRTVASGLQQLGGSK